MAADPLEEHPQEVAKLTGKAADAAKMLSGVLDQYADARPPEVVAAAETGTKAQRGKNAAKIKR